MADDPGHKAMLYILETLMNSTVPLTISQLAGRFGSRNFTPVMRSAAGGNEAGLKKFLQKYPSLFFVNGNLVSLNDGSASLGKNFRESSPASSSSSRSLPDVSVETEAVQYFRAKMLKKEEKWLPIRSLAGHLSQASFEIRECVGPQNEFTDWLLKHPYIFELNGEMVSLKDNINYSAVTPSRTSVDDVSINNSYGEKPSSLQYTPKMKRRPKSLSDFPESSKSQASKFLAPPPSKAGPITMTANEYKAVMFVKGIIEKKGDTKLSSLSAHFNQAPESLRNTIGWSKPELSTFIENHSNIFTLSSDETVSVIQNARLNVIITGSRPQANTKPTVMSRKGRVYHVAKLWGIIDLGRHEHVFIDRCIFGKQLDDLNKVLTVGEMCCFDAIPAPKGSRARWRATKVWKEHESIEELIEKVATKLSLPLDSLMTNEPRSPITNIDDEMKQIIPELDDNIPTSPVSVGGMKYAFSDAAPSGAGVVPVWNFKHIELKDMQDPDDIFLSDEEESPNLSMVAERYYMNRSVLGDSPRDDKKSPKTNGHLTDEEVQESTDLDSSKTKPVKVKMYDAGCQTIVTGEVLATQLYHEEF